MICESLVQFRKLYLLTPILTQNAEICIHNMSAFTFKNWMFATFQYQYLYISFYYILQK